MNMCDVPITCKRILIKSEIDELINLLKDSWLKEEYGDHYDSWLDKAIDEIFNNSRQAYGVFKATFDEESVVSKLIGGCIINLVDGMMIELKSFALKKCNESDHNMIYAKLHHTIESVAIERGYKGIYTTIPCDVDHELLISFINSGYVIGGISERYDPFKPTYFLTKKVKSIYTGDPYDWKSIAKWYLTENLRGADIVEVCDGLYTTNLELDRGMDISIDVFISEDETKYELIPNDLKKAEFSMAMIKDPKESHHVNKVISEMDILNSKNIMQPPRFDKSEINGLIVPIEKEYIDFASQKPEFVYVKGGGSGKYACHDGTIIFYQMLNFKESDGLVGYGNIIEVSEGSPAEIWEKYSQYMIMKKEKYDEFSRRKKKILAYKISDYRRYDEIVAVEEVNHRYGLDVHKSQLGVYYLSKVDVEKLTQIKTLSPTEYIMNSLKPIGYAHEKN